jgi:glutamate synthase (NADPH/NADH) large chain
MAVVHSRFSTNTFPSWPLAHPFRFIAHNGEINTVKGNRNWMRAREALLASDLIPGDRPPLPDLHARGLGLGVLRRGPRAAAPRWPLAAALGADDDPGGLGEPRRDGRQASRLLRVPLHLMEPWDGPACVVFTDGTQVGAVLDRNGLRPGRYWVTDDGLVVSPPRSASSTSTPPRSSARAASSPARCSSSTPPSTASSRTTSSRPSLAAEHPYDEWLDAGLIRLDELPEREHIVHTHASVTRRQQVFGYTEEELRVLL